MVAVHSECDASTENVYIINMQRLFHEDDEDENTANTKI
jgi:hypothetical protein